MRTLGIALKKGELWFAVLEGHGKESASIVKLDKHQFNAEQSETELMLDFFNLFTEIITANEPESVGYKIHINSTLGQLPYMQFSLGILNYICKMKNIPTTGRSGTWITAGKNKKTTACQTHFEQHNLKNEKLASTLVAWYQFEN